MWTDCQPQAGPQTAQTGQVAVATNVRGISPQLVLQVFDATPVQDGGRYLGEFRVAEVQEAAGLLTLEPSLRMSARELQRLATGAASGATWTLYETMPVDTHETFADLTPEQLKQLLPADSVEEYLNDGKMLDSDEVAALGLRGELVAVDERGRVIYADQEGQSLFASGVDASGRLVYVDAEDQFVCAAAIPKDVDAADEVPSAIVYVDQNDQVMPGMRVVEKQVTEGQGKYVRPLHDYWILLGDSRLQYVTLTDQKAIAEGDLGLVQKALAEAEGQLQFREREKARLTTEAQSLESELAIVGGLRDRVQREVDDYLAATSELIVQNMVAANQLGEIQQKAVENINARTAAMATATP